jgi:hypothetical protein
MSIEVQYYTLVIRRDALERLTLPARETCLQRCGFGGEIFRQDEHLVATGYMGPRDVEDCLSDLQSHGLRLTDEQGAFLDMAVVQESFGIPRPCSWLELSWTPRSMEACQKEIESMIGTGTQIIQIGGGQAPDHCWLTGFPPGDLAEVPFLKAEPKLRESKNYVMFPSGATTG